jgi:hypothetical protein
MLQAYNPNPIFLLLRTRYINFYSLFTLSLVPHLSITSHWIPIFSHPFSVATISVKPAGRRGQMEPLVFIPFIECRQQYRRVCFFNKISGHKHVSSIDSVAIFPFYLCFYIGDIRPKTSEREEQHCTDSI